ncbi:replication-relaxation family protein [Aneurinibacillus thermoaerophilus]|uniref:replication-relaxation family protein n=1 Tax=Aneurinibacillus thermoaerophilus TaxID=143495 RepID=UPI002E222E21|nr:replication-relaxation family protein [Aneurinibacillus thermoaerophilus]
MKIVADKAISLQKERILKALFKFRGSTAEQLLTALNPTQYPYGFFEKGTTTKRPAKLFKIYTALSELCIDGLVVKDPIPPKNKKYLYSLSRLGLEIAHMLYDIEPGYIGTGYNNDYGDFSYEVYQPPRGRLLHHMLLVDFFLQMERLKNEYENLNSEYRDNRYISEKYQWSPGELIKDDEKSYFFRPDAEIKIQDKVYWVEIDRGTEFFEELKNKFEGYERYLNYLSSMDRHIPEGILFVTEKREQVHGFKRRWKTVTEAFFSKMKGWAARVNLSAISVDKVDEFVLREAEEKYRFADFAKKVGYYLSPLNEKLRLIDANSGISWERVVFSITPGNESDHLFIYERFEGFETRAIARVNEFISRFSEIKRNVREFSRIKAITPVFYYHDAAAATVIPRTFDNPEQIDQFLKSAYYLKTKGEPTWRNAIGEVINTNNPLVTR